MTSAHFPKFVLCLCALFRELRKVMGTSKPIDSSAAVLFEVPGPSSPLVVQELQIGCASLTQRVFAEWLGTAFLLAAVVGSGIMAQRLAGGNVAIALLCNTIPTGAILVVLILMFGPVSGAHFNPAVTLAFALRGETTWLDGATYVVAQLAGAIAGVWAAHLMFDLPVWQFSLTERAGTGQWLAEAIATFGLLATIFGVAARTPSAVPYAVGLYITAAYWFTASTSFANPAVTIARSLSDTFAGIAPHGVAAFIGAQLIGAAFAIPLARWLWSPAAAR